MVEKLNIKNDKPSKFLKKLLLVEGGINNNKRKYIVETLKDSTIIELQKPGFKGENDIQIWASKDGKEWMPDFEELLKDFNQKKIDNEKKFSNLYNTYICTVFKGEDPENLVINIVVDGLSYEYILKVLKWWFGEEDCNYPMAKGYQGRKMIMYRIRELLDGIPFDTVLKRAKMRGRPPPDNLPNVDYKQVDDLLNSL